MWHTGIRTSRACRRQRGAALCLVALLITVLSVFLLTAVDYYVTGLQRDQDATGDARAKYLAELGLADATAYVNSGVSDTWPYEHPLTAIYDDQGKLAGEYSYTVTQPAGNRRQITVTAYWPSQASPLAVRNIKMWMRFQAGQWHRRAWTNSDVIAGPDG